jgi:hypothetical protein
VIFCGCSRQQASDDGAITSSIEAQLFQDPVLKTRDVHVVSEKGVVVLTGSVASEAEKSTIESIAREARGVKQVIDELTLNAASSESAAPAQPEPAVAAPPRSRPRRHARHEEHEESYAAKQEIIAQSQPNPSASTSQPATSAQPVPSAPPPHPIAANPEPAAPPPPPPPLRLTVPAGSVISVRMVDPVDSERDHPGDEFAASVIAPVVVNDHVVVQQGADARVRLIDARTAGHMQGQSMLQVELIAVSAGGRSYPVESTYYSTSGSSRGRRTAETVGGGAGLGAIIGAIAGGGKGAAIGAGVGAAAGGAGQAATKAQQVRIPSEAKIDFTLRTPINVTIDRHSSQPSESGA